MIVSRMTTILLRAGSRFGIIYSAKPRQILNFFADGWGAYCCQVVRKMGGQASKSAQTKMRPHIKARCSPYPRSDVQRFRVPDSMVPWATPFPQYKPMNYTSSKILAGPDWADVDVRNVDRPVLKWNQVDGKVDRRSHIGIYSIVDGVPRNPMGRTGIVGRGCLGRWGPNHAADPVVTRWKCDDSGNIQTKGTRKVAQFVAIQRKDTKEWAIPGGMVDAGETVTVTLQREFGEEALNSLKVPLENKSNINALFRHGTEIYSGYVDDPRNTDNAWMETVVMNFHDENGKSVGSIQLQAGDDAQAVQWMDLDKSLNLFASHTYFLQMVAEQLDASW